MTLSKDPLNLIITGVGGQGNVLASQLIGRALVRENFYVTIGETYGASQRGGAVMSHLRISRQSQHSPLIPEGQADIVVALEPVEALRVIGQYGNPSVSAVVNSRPIYPTAVTVGDAEYPSFEKIQETIRDLAKKAWFVDATEIALALGSPIFTNIIMVGALVGTDLLPLSQRAFEEIIKESSPGAQLSDNLKAFRRGLEKTQGI
ncbi:MAG: indolepyruvate oxidoreductase subunit beta [Deltaproteobacteria bacterium]|nr:indolepyruvate oxidoreductase subunit beta [Deltaproteobacteria bacterium]